MDQEWAEMLTSILHCS